MSDRTVHAFSDQMEVVRYDRAGKWYLEPKDGSLLQRQQVTLAEAVDFAMWAWKNGGSPCFSRPGGGAFDREIRKRCAPSGTSEETG